MHTHLETGEPASHALVVTAPIPRSNATPEAGPGGLPEDMALSALLAWVYSLLFCLGLAGNLLALWVFHRVPSKKNSVRVFLVHTAMADLLLVGCLPFRVAYHSQGNHWALGHHMCRIVGILFYMNMYISIVLLGLISVDRYLKLHRVAGLQRGLRATRWSYVFCGATWVTSIALALPLIFSPSTAEVDPNRCFQYKVLERAKWKAYINLLVVAVFWLVFLALVVSYGKIALMLRRAARRRPQLANAAHYARTARKYFVVLFIFTVCFAPYHVVRVLYVVTQVTPASLYWRGVADRANEVSLLFSALNSCLDPVMYFVLSSSVRREALRLVNAAFRTSEGGPGGSGTEGASPH